jgi:hypothetical protein
MLRNKGTCDHVLMKVLSVLPIGMDGISMIKVQDTLLDVKVKGKTKQKLNARIVTHAVTSAETALHQR